MSSIEVSGVQFTAANGLHRRSGLLGWVKCEVNGALALDSIAVRRTAGGQLRLSFPERRDRRGHGWPYIRPVDTATRVSLEEQILAALEPQELAS